MTANLFVYGTLMRVAAASALGRDMRDRLDRESNWVGAATVAGRLYNCGSYPGLVAGETPGERVHGELYRLRDPDAVFRWLDPYEGLSCGQLIGTEYERLVVPAQLDTGAHTDAWIYRYLKAVDPSSHLPDGRWHAGRRPSSR